MTIPITILYASETGCSTDVARRINRELKRLGFLTTLTVMDHYPIENLPHEKYVLFICSTTGQGQTPDNMNQFWNFLLRSDLPLNSLQNVKYSIFGLGDRSYPLYNAVARRLDKRLQSLGAIEFAPIGLGDDQHPMGYDGGLILWQVSLLEALLDEIDQHFSHEINLQQQLSNAVISSRLSLEDATTVPTTMTADQQDAILNSTSMTNETSPPQQFKTDYLAHSSVSITVLKNDNFIQTEFNELLESPLLQQIIYFAMIRPSLSQWERILTPQQYSLLLTPTDELLQMVTNIFQNSIGSPIQFPTTCYHQITPTPTFFSPDSLLQQIEPILNDILSQSSTSITQSTKKPITLSTSYKSLPILSSTHLTASGHYQDVNHIQYDFTPLITNNSTTTLSNSQPILIDDIIESPPYLPGDVLEVIPPTPTILVNAILTLYQLDPNDIIFIQQTNKHHSNSNPNSNYQPLTFTDSISDFFFSIMEQQSEIDDNNNNDDKPLPTKELIYERYESFPLCIRVWELLTWYLHLTLTPQRHHFLMLAQQATNPSEQERLIDLCSASFASTLDSYCIRERRSITEVFSDFPSSILPLNWVIELCDRIKPRQFSLSSSPLYNLISIPTTISTTSLPQPISLSQIIPSFSTFSTYPQQLPIQQQQSSSTISTHGKLIGSICLATVKYTTPFKRSKFGLCSSYLDSLANTVQQRQLQHGINTDTELQHYIDPRDNGYTINYPIRSNLITSTTSSSLSTPLSIQYNPYILAKVKQGSFRYDIIKRNNQQFPTIAIGPGTGIAALHAIVEHRIAYLLYTILKSNQSQLFVQQLFQPQIQFQTLSQSSRSIQQFLFSQPPQLINESISPNSSNICTQESKQQQQQQLILQQSTILPIEFQSILHPFTILFGCRSIQSDHFYRDFFNYAVHIGALTEYHSIFSRNKHNPYFTKSIYTNAIELLQQHSIQYSHSLLNSSECNDELNQDGIKFGSIDRYVQDRLLSNVQLNEQLISLINPQFIPKPKSDSTITTENNNQQQLCFDFDISSHGGDIIVAGNAKRMPVDVQNTIVDILLESIQKRNTLNQNEQQLYDISREDVKRYVNIMAKRGRYILECWM